MNCSFCNKHFTSSNGLKNHALRCKANPNKISCTAVCKFFECNRFCKSYGYCSGHARQKERGIELRPLRQDVTIENKYLALVIIPENKNECYGWSGPVFKKRPSSTGYAHFNYSCKNIWAHRYSWERFNNKVIPEGFNIDHLCRNTICTNPLHLELTTPAENNKRMKAYKNLMAQIQFLEKICTKYKINLEEEGYANIFSNG